MNRDPRGRRFAGLTRPAAVSLFMAAACSSGGSGGSGNPIAPGPQPPPATNTAPEVTLSGDASVDAGHPITLTVQATDADGITHIVITWGDGTADTLQVGGATSHQSTFTRTYGRVGTFQVEAIATDSRSATGRAVHSVTTVGGALDIGLAHTAGSARLIARATVTVASQNHSVRDGEVTTVRNLVPGDHQISAAAVRPDCAIEGEATRTVRIDASSTARVDFSITCTFVPEERIVYNTLTPDGNGSAVSTTRPDGSDRKNLTFPAPLSGFPDLSPDGTRILYGLRSLRIMNYDGTEVTSLSPGGAADWSPDGRRIVFSRDGDLVVADLDGRRLTNVVSLTNDGSAVDDGGPSWSPDGSTIAFHRGGVVHLIRADGSNLRALVPGGLPVWMPDGRRIVFVDTGLGQIASMEADGTDVRVLTDQAGGAGHPGPSPDGGSIVFHSPRLSAQARIWVMNADGTDPRIIEAIPVGAEHASWGPP